MDREILFRGKTVDNEKWVEGNLIIDTYNKSDNIEKSYRIVNRVCGVDELGYITYESCIDEKINQSTIGQYTGMTDKNGKRIFEGDIICLKDVYADVQWNAVVSFGNPHGRYTWGWELVPIGEPVVNTDILCWVEMEESGAFCEVIGNIYDNPELLERGRE